MSILDCQEIRVGNSIYIFCITSSCQVTCWMLKYALWAFANLVDSCQHPCLLIKLWQTVQNPIIKSNTYSVTKYFWRKCFIESVTSWKYVKKKMKKYLYSCNRDHLRSIRNTVACLPNGRNYYFQFQFSFFLNSIETGWLCHISDCVTVRTYLSYPTDMFAERKVHTVHTMQCILWWLPVKKMDSDLSNFQGHIYYAILHGDGLKVDHILTDPKMY